MGSPHGEIGLFPTIQRQIGLWRHLYLLQPPAHASAFRRIRQGFTRATVIHRLSSRIGRVCQ